MTDICISTAHIIAAFAWYLIARRVPIVPQGPKYLRGSVGVGLVMYAACTNPKPLTATLWYMYDNGSHSHLGESNARIGFGVLRKLFKNPRAKPDGTKMFCSAFLNDARMCCFFANAIVKY